MLAEQRVHRLACLASDTVRSVRLKAVVAIATATCADKELLSANVQQQHHEADAAAQVVRCRRDATMSPQQQRSKAISISSARSSSRRSRGKRSALLTGVG